MRIFFFLKPFVNEHLISFCNAVDEFGMGSGCVNSFYGPTKNVWRSGLPYSLQAGRTNFLNFLWWPRVPEPVLFGRSRLKRTDSGSSFINFLEVQQNFKFLWSLSKFLVSKNKFLTAFSVIVWVLFYYIQNVVLIVLFFWICYKLFDKEPELIIFVFPEP